MKKIVISSIASCYLMLQSSYALPSGGKFTHGTSGSISQSGNSMNIHGNGANSVIQWGGGFNINHGESVNFGGANKNYLNIAYGNSKSMIDGILNAKGNNVYLINPNGVVIGKNGVINASKFVASTSSLSSAQMWDFAKNGANFSPIFKPEKIGNVINLGNINAGNVLFIANKVDLKQGQLNTKEAHLVGNEIYVNVDNVNTQKAILSAYKKANLIQNASSFYNQDKLSIFNFETQDYLNNTNALNKDQVLKHFSMANDKDWFLFAKGWDENKNNMRSVIDVFSLENDIDFKGDDKSGRKNYLNYCIDGLGCYNLVVGKNEASAFNKTFDGQGFSLKNMRISDNHLEGDNISWTYDTHYAGIFGLARNASFKNIDLDYNYNKIDVYMTGAKDGFVGGFIAKAENSNFSNISLKNIFEIRAARTVGGFIGNDFGSSFNKIEVSNIADKNGKLAGGIYNNLHYAGGFAGILENSKFDNIIINNINTVIAESYTGGFVGYAKNSEFKNIILNDMGSSQAVTLVGNNPFDPYKSSGIAGGFAGKLENSNLSDVYLYFKDKSILQGTTIGRFVGENIGGSFNNINLYNAALFKNSEDRLWCQISPAMCNTIANGWNQSEINLGIKDRIYRNDAKDEFATLIKNNTNFKDLIFENQNFAFKKDKDFSSDYILSADDVDLHALFEAMRDIFEGNYIIYLSDLAKLEGLNEEILNSLAFIEALYNQEGFKTILMKLSTEHKDFITQTIDDKVFNNYKTLISFLFTYKQNIQDNLDKIKANNELIKAYNDYVALINAGLASKDEAYEALKSKALTAYEQNEILFSEFQTLSSNLKYDFGKGLEQVFAKHNFEIYYKDSGAKGSIEIKNFTPNLENLSLVQDENQNNKPNTDDEASAIPDLDFNVASLLILQDHLEENPDEEEKEVKLNEGKIFGTTCIVSGDAKTSNMCSTN